MARELEHSAAASAYGYFFQLCRTIERLLVNADARAVAIEALDDVVEYNVGGIISEQDKTTLARTNPLTNSSPNLWKTLRIWTELEQQRGTDISKFMLITNSDVLPQQNTFVGRLLSNMNETDTALVGDILAHDTDDEQIAGIIKFLRSHEVVLSNVLAKVEVFFGQKADVLAVARKIQCPESLQEDVARSLVGWIFDLCMRHWENGTTVVVDRGCFLQALTVIVQRLRSDSWRVRPELEILLSPSDIEARTGSRFVEHLIAINLEEESIFDAIEDFLRTESETTRLLNEGDVLPSHFKNLENECVRHWDSVTGEVKLVNANLDLDNQGRLVWIKTSSCRNLCLADVIIAESYFVCGSFHALAEKDRVAWHPQYWDSLQPRSA